MRATATLALLMIALPVRAQCVRLPDPVGPTDPQARFRTARAHYDAGRLGEAAVLFRSTALDPAAGELAEPAADLCLDALSSAAERDLSCAWELALSAEQLQAALCIAPVAPRREGFCERLDRLRCAVVARVIERLAADQRYEAALHLSLQHLTSACPDRDQVLHNAAIFAERVGNRARASSLRQELIARHPRSPLAAGALHALAAERRGVADYAAAADLYERFAERYPAERASCDQPRACPDAIRALETAVFLRMALGELDLAIRDADRFARNYARSEPARTAEIAIGIVARLESAGRTREARTRAEAILRSPDPAPIDVRLLASVIAARTSTGAARASHLEVARALSPSVERAVVDRHPEPDEQALRLARARDAIGEALFMSTDAAHAALLRESAVAPEALATLADALAPIAALHVPAWTIAATERLAEAYEHASARAPALRAQAIDHYAACLRLATQARWLDARAERCARALTRLDPAHHPDGPLEIVGAMIIATPAAPPDPEPALRALSAGPPGER